MFVVTYRRSRPFELANTSLGIEVIMFEDNRLNNNSENNEKRLSSQMNKLMQLYICIFIWSLCIDFPLYGARYVGVESDICCVRGKQQRDYTLILTSLFRECSLIREKILISGQLRNRLVQMKVQSLCFFPYNC